MQAAEMFFQSSVSLSWVKWWHMDETVAPAVSGAVVHTEGLVVSKLQRQQIQSQTGSISVDTLDSFPVL